MNTRSQQPAATLGGRSVPDRPAATDTPEPVNYVAVAVAAGAAFVASAAYYTLLAGTWLSLRGLAAGSAPRPGVGEVAGQYLRNLVVATAFAYLLNRAGHRSVLVSLKTAVVVWAGFQAMAIAGSVLHEGYPVGLFLLHAGDALMTTLLMALIVGGRRRRPRRWQAIVQRLRPSGDTAASRGTRGLHQWRPRAGLRRRGVPMPVNFCRHDPVGARQRGARS